MTQEERDQLKRGFIRAIQETNRCLTINGYRGDVARMLPDMMSLFKTWVCREVRRTHILGYGGVNDLFKCINVLFTAGNSCWIAGIKVYTKPWHRNNDPLLTCKRILEEEILYADCRYNPPLTNIQNSEFSRQSSLLDTVKNFDLSTITKLINS